MRYLTSGRLDGWKSPISIRQRRKNSIYHTKQKDANMAHSFLDYAASNICAHVSKIGSADETLFIALNEFMSADNHAFTSWLELTDIVNPPQNMSPLHIAAHNGMLNYCQHLIQLGQDVRGLDDASRTPISWPAIKGHANIVAILLENGADADLDDCEGLKPLHYAAKANQFEVVKILLAAGVDPLTPRTKDYSRRRCGILHLQLGIPHCTTLV